VQSHCNDDNAYVAQLVVSKLRSGIFDVGNYDGSHDATVSNSNDTFAP
jgi:hypothetical protein